MKPSDAIYKLEFMRNAYQKLIDEKVDEGRFVGYEVTGTWKADTPLNEVYREQIDAINTAIAALKEQERTRWHPVLDGDGEMPEVNKYGESDYVLVNFSNAPGMFDIAQYRVDENGGSFYSGDNDDPYTKFGVFVSAWRPLPELYREDEA